MNPIIPLGPMVTLKYRVAPENRSAFLAFLREAFVFYEKPGGIKMALYESADEPNVYFEIAAYAGEREYEADQLRVENDPETLAVLARFKSFIDGRVEVLRVRPLL